MTRGLIPLTAIGLWAGAAFGQRIVRVDLLDRIFPDRTPPAATYEPVSVPRGGHVAFQFALACPEETAGKISVSPILRKGGGEFPGSTALYRLLPVHVEANTQGSMKTRVGGKIPDG